MANFPQNSSQFGKGLPAQPKGKRDCAQCEAMLADVLDGTLSPTEQAEFDLHIADCTTCSRMFADAQHGAAWLELLRASRPEPSAMLVEQILAKTSLPTGETLTNGVPAPRTATILPFRSRRFSLRSLGEAMLQPRLAMTAAMAFFSIGLTLNLTGVRLNELHTGNLTPSNMKRSFYQANAHVVRYVDNLSAVYELESRVGDLERENDDDTPAADPTPGSNPPQPEQQKQLNPRPGSGTSRQEEPTVRARPAFLPVNFISTPLRRSVPVSAATNGPLQKGVSL